MKKKLSFLAMAAILVALLGGCSDQDELTEVMVSEFRAVSYSPAHLAYELGYFEEEGLDVSFAIYKDGPAALQGMQAEASDFCMIGQGPIFLAYDEGMESEVVIAVKQSRPFCIVTTPDIEDLSQLEGKTVFAGLPGSEPYLLMCYALERAGVENPEESVNFVNLDYGSSLVALGEGQISASYFGVEYKDDFSKFDVNVLLDTSDPAVSLDFFGTENFITDVICCTKQFSDENPEIVQSFVNAIIKALDWMHEHSPEEAAQALDPLYEAMDIDEIATKVGLLEGSFSVDGFISRDSYDAVADFFAKYDIPSQRVDYEDIINMEYVENANT